MMKPFFLLLRVGLTWLCVLTLAMLSRADEMTSAPILRIETGMHTASIKSIATDAANRFAVTGSDDKTVRVWDLTTGALLRTLRPPIGEGGEGKIYAIALSPDGNTVACGGWTNKDATSQSIYLFDRANGTMRRLASNLADRVNALTFSKDGFLLAAGLKSNGIRVYRIADHALVGQDSGYKDSCYGLDFDAKGRLVASCRDGFVRLYDSNIRVTAKTKMPPNKQPWAVRFSPDGKAVALGFGETSQVVVLDGGDLRTRYWPDTGSSNQGSLARVAWSLDGQILFAGGEWGEKAGAKYIRRWSKAGQGAFSDLPTGTTNTLFEMVALRDGGLLWSSAAPAWGALDANGYRRLLALPSVPDYRANWQGFGVSASGSAVDFGFRFRGAVPARFDVGQRALQAVGQPKLRSLLLTDTFSPQQTAANLKIVWAQTTFPTLNDKPLPLKSYETSRAVAIAPGEKSFLLGAEWTLRRFDRQGKEVWRIPAPAITWAVNISRDGRLAVAAFGDGTIRWYRYSDGVELLALFPHPDGKRWVLWTPQGFYDCSLGGEDLIGWHVNNGPDRAADFFSASRFHDTFYRPDIIALVLQTLDVEKARRQADGPTNVAPAPNVAQVVAQNSPPLVRFVAPVDAVQTTDTKITLRYALRTPTGDPVKAVKVLVNGRPVGGQSDLNVAPVKTDEAMGSMEVEVPPRDCEVSLLAINSRFAVSDPAVLKVWRTTNRGVEVDSAPSVQEPVAAPHGKLWVLSIGVQNYPTSLPSLSFCDDDAGAICDVMKQQDAKHGGPYEAVETRLLLDGDRAAILNGLKWLQKNVGRDDRAIIFLAGHGITTERGYYFLPAACGKDDWDVNGLAFSEFVNAAPSIKGQVLMMVDTCRAADIAGRASANDFNGAMFQLSQPGRGWSVLAACGGNQNARENAQWKHGAFTWAILKGFDDGVGAPDGAIYLKMLDSFVGRTVGTLTSGEQTPISTIISTSEQKIGQKLPAPFLLGWARTGTHRAAGG